jgi:glycosyltransferase 2 family protein
VSAARSAVLRLLPIAIAAALLVYIFRVVPFGEVLGALHSARFGGVVLGLGLLLVARIIAARRMQLLTEKQGLSLSLAELFEISTATTFYGLILPGTLSGGVVRWYKLAKRGNAIGALASMTWDRLADAAMVVVVGVVCWAISRPAGAHAAVGPLLLTICAALVALYLAGFSRRVGEPLLRVCARVGQRAPAGWLRRKSEELVAAARVYHGAGRGFSYRVAVLSLGTQLAGAAAFYAWAAALGLPVGFAELTWARACYTLVVLLPVTFAGLGAREGILILLLQPYGVTGAQAVAVAFLQLGGTFVLAALGGLFELRSVCRARHLEPERGQPS